MASSIRVRKAPQAVSPKWSWVVGPFAVVEGEPVGVLKINGTPYTVEAIGDDGRVLGFRLTKESGEIYDIDIADAHWVCDCPDGTFQSERPGGCKHVVALRSAIGSIVPARPVARTVCRTCGGDGRYYEEGAMFPCYECDSSGQPEINQSYPVAAEQVDADARHQAVVDLVTLTQWAETTLWAGVPCVCEDATCVRCRTEEVVCRLSNDYRRMKEETPF